MRDRVDIVILCGGQGRRLRPVLECLAPIHGWTFLDLLLHYLRDFHLNRFILCTGYQGEAIEELGNLSDAREFVFSREDQPLGTAGALKHAEPFIQSDPFLVLNGASLCEADLEAFAAFHNDRKAVASVVASSDAPDAGYGSIEIDTDRRITGFSNKASTGRGLSNAGIYFFNRSVLDRIPAGRHCSLEDDLLPALVGSDFYAFATDAALIDVATPERHDQAQHLLRLRCERLTSASER